MKTVFKSNETIQEWVNPKEKKDVKYVSFVSGVSFNNGTMHVDVAVKTIDNSVEVSNEDIVVNGHGAWKGNFGLQVDLESEPNPEVATFKEALDFLANKSLENYFTTDTAFGIKKWIKNESN